MTAMPPAPWTASSHACCSGLMRPVGVLTSMLVKTASLVPTMAWVTVMVRQPIRSADPRARPKVTRRPVRGSGKEPTWLRNNRVSGLMPTARRICCWRMVSALAMLALAGELHMFSPGDRVLHASLLAEVDELLQGLGLALIAAPAAGDGIAC